MIRQYSKTVLFVIVASMALIRLYYTVSEPNTAKILTWDAFGYYLYLPGQFIYHDLKKMDWVSEVNNKYQTTGSLYQLSKELPTGNRVIKYFLGVSLLYSPFFGIGHLTAGIFNYPQDGFSAPYQIAICFAALFYAFIGLYVLRWVLLRYFSDTVTSITLVLVALGTNYAQYVSVNSGMSHGYIFTLYAFLLAATVAWHERPSLIRASLVGLLVGLGILSRPTEAVMLFIPLLYGTHQLISKKEKWLLVRQHPSHIAAAIGCCILALFPQLLYWKFVTGHWIYDVGSKWTFLQPNWQVLFGWEKGWFIYTPVAILMVLGLYYLRRNPFFWSVLTYFILNVWIVTAWDDWRYGASYSSRALVQSYAVMSLPLAIMIERIISHK